jgi:hypothetical protein
MQSLAILVGLGLVGGFVIALLIIKLHGHLRGPSSAEAFVHRPLSTDVINMASIKVAGIGGLGMVFVSALVALTIPAVGLSVGTGLVTGIVMALFLIRRRRRAGVLPSSSKGPGANTTLAIDASDSKHNGVSNHGQQARVPPSEFLIPSDRPAVG